jgi:Holliday junction resolvase RusA-like endonuclease
MRPLIVIPWKFLAQCNHRLMPVIRGNKARLITAAGYREAKERAEWHIKKHWKGQPLTVPVQLEARCYFPDRRKRDAGNLSKMVLDAMSGIVFDDDSQVEDERWIKAGYDKRDPRIEVSVLPLPEKHE